MTATTRLPAFAGSLREGSCNCHLIPVRAAVHGVGAAAVRLAAAQALARVPAPVQVSA